MTGIFALYGAAMILNIIAAFDKYSKQKYSWSCLNFFLAGLSLGFLIGLMF